jgi:hypothetical protein
MKKLILILSVFTPAIHAWNDREVLNDMQEAARKATKQEQRKNKVQNYLDHQMNSEEQVTHYQSPSVFPSATQYIAGACFLAVAGACIVTNLLHDRSQQQ